MWGGCVRVYGFEQSNSSWIQRGLDINGEAANDNLGRAISLSADSESVAIGSPNGNANKGNVRVFSIDN